MNEMMKPPMAKKKKSKMRQRISGRDGASAMFDTAEQTKMNEMMKKRKPRPAPKEMMMGGKVKGYKAGGELKMVEKDGKEVPFYAADGKGKMKSGGKVKGYKSGGSTCGTKKAYKSGGKVRGAGCATKGVRPCKMR